MEVVDYPDYLIYPDGKLFSKKRNIYMKEQTHRLGYKYYYIYKDGKRKKFYIHRLVAIHFIPNSENLSEVDHLNRNKVDNRVENLRWITRSDNCLNKDIIKTNTSGVKNIRFHRGKWVYEKTINKNKIYKCFNTIEEAIEFRHKILNSPE